MQRSKKLRYRISIMFTFEFMFVILIAFLFTLILRFHLWRHNIFSWMHVLHLRSKNELSFLFTILCTSFYIQHKNNYLIKIIRKLKNSHIDSVPLYLFVIAYTSLYFKVIKKFSNFVEFSIKISAKFENFQEIILQSK